jgi:hypothetical protein
VPDSYRSGSQRRMELPAVTKAAREGFCRLAGITLATRSLSRSVAALRAQFVRAFAPSPSSGGPISELTSAGVNGGILKWKAKRNVHRAIGKKQRSTPSWPVPANAISQASCSEGLQNDMLEWPRTWNGGRLSRTRLLRLSPNRRGRGRHLKRGAFSRLRRGPIDPERVARDFQSAKTGLAPLHCRERTTAINRRSRDVSGSVIWRRSPRSRLANPNPRHRAAWRGRRSALNTKRLRGCRPLTSACFALS